MIINRKHIGLEEAGIDSATSVKKIAYDNRIVIASEIRSPDSTGSKNTTGLRKHSNMVGRIIITAWYLGFRFSDIFTWYE